MLAHLSMLGAGAPIAMAQQLAQQKQQAVERSQQPGVQRNDGFAATSAGTPWQSSIGGLRTPAADSIAPPATERRSVVSFPDFLSPQTPQALSSPLTAPRNPISERSAKSTDLIGERISSDAVDMTMTNRTDRSPRMTGYISSPSVEGNSIHGEVLSPRLTDTSSTAFTSPHKPLDISSSIENSQPLASPAPSRSPRRRPMRPVPHEEDAASVQAKAVLPQIPIDPLASEVQTALRTAREHHSSGESALADLAEKSLQADPRNYSQVMQCVVVVINLLFHSDSFI